ncbi:MAG: DUF6455 family protein [bacterium]
MFERIKTLVQQWHDLKDIDAMSDSDLSDLGMTRDQVRRFARMPEDTADRVTHMAAVFGLSEADTRRDYYRYIDLLNTCGSCTHRGECAQVLARGAAAKPEDCGFCRNAKAFSDSAAA